MGIGLGARGRSIDEYGAPVTWIMMPEYIVVSRAASALYFPENGYFRVNSFPSPFGPLQLLFQTRRSWLKDHQTPVPRGLWVEIRGQAPTLRDALDLFPQIAGTVCPILTFVANAPTEPLVPELAFDRSPDSPEREFFQQFLFDERLLPFVRPKFPGDSARALMELMSKHPDQDRIHRAMAQYHAAVQSWFVGGEIMALGHLYMAVEALTPVAIRSHLKAAGGISREKLATQWGVEVRHLDSEARKRLIFDNDAELYSRAKEASDGFEHGYLPFQTIRQHAIATRNGAAKAVRRTILRLLAIPQAHAAVLLSPPFDEIPTLRVDKYVFGTLRGTLDSLALDTESYPILGWSSRVKEIILNPDGTTRIKFEETMSPRLGTGTSLSLMSLEVWSGASKGPTPEGA